MSSLHEKNYCIYRTVYIEYIEIILPNSRLFHLQEQQDLKNKLTWLGVKYKENYRCEVIHFISTLVRAPPMNHRNCLGKVV